VLEAQNRVGGRIYTLREPFAPGLYAEAGGMRIPRAHDLTLRYCDLFELPMRPFVMGNPRALVHLGGQRMTKAEATRPAGSPSRFEHASRTAAFRGGDRAASGVRRGAGVGPHHPRLDRYSLYEFLGRLVQGDRVLHGYQLPRDMHNSLVEILREELGGAYVDMQEIAGGMDQLPNAFYAQLQDEVRFGANVFALDQDPNGVTVHFKTEAGRFQAHADFAIVTVPFSVLRTIETITPFSGAKQRAIRQLNYHASTKILFQVRERFWEDEDGIFGGGTVTELPIRRMNYPTPDPTTRRGVLLASSPPQDALQWRDGRGDAPRRRLDDVHTRGSATSTRAARRMPAQRSLGSRGLRDVRPGTADRAAGGHRQPRGENPLRRRALLALPRLDPGSPRIGDPGCAGDPRGTDGRRLRHPGVAGGHRGSTRRPSERSPPLAVRPHGAHPAGRHARSTQKGPSTGRARDCARGPLDRARRMRGGRLAVGVADILDGCRRTPRSPLEASIMATPSDTPAAMTPEPHVAGVCRRRSDPARDSCRGETSPALAWQGAGGDRGLVLFVDDPDGGNWVHWTVLDLPGADGGLPRGVPPVAEAPQQGRNDFRKPGYGGPCPPSGNHHYRFTLHALAAPLDLTGHPDGRTVRAALAKATVLGTATLVGTFRA
jgi:Raf kinase inhibitor-like YbhB/YbcL family protein